MGFKDLFSAHAADYARYRPRYPRALFDHLLARCPQHRLAWDCATGNAQAAEELARGFERVIASDASADQVSQAKTIPNVEYRIWPAEKTELANASVDLITVAQALHWFDFAAFGREVRRIAAPEAWLAVWCYSTAKIDPEIDQVTERFYNGDLRTHWELNRAWVDKGYEGIDLPLEREERPQFAMSVDMNLDAWLNYLGTWSALKTAKRKTGSDPLEARAPEFQKAWGEPDRVRPVTFPLHLRMGPIAR